MEHKLCYVETNATYSRIVKFPLRFCRSARHYREARTLKNKSEKIFRNYGIDYCWLKHTVASLSVLQGSCPGLFRDV